MAYGIYVIIFQRNFVSLRSSRRQKAQQVCRNGIIFCVILLSKLCFSRLRIRDVFQLIPPLCYEKVSYQQNYTASPYYFIITTPTNSKTTRNTLRFCDNVNVAKINFLPSFAINYGCNVIIVTLERSRLQVGL